MRKRPLISLLVAVLGACSATHAEPKPSALGTSGVAPSVSAAASVPPEPEIVKNAKSVEETFEGKKAHTLDATRLASLEAFIEDGRRAAKIPGVAVAIVQGGKVVFEKGFGVRELGKNDPVTPSTLFRIGSITKPLTSLMIASLVTAGKLDWNTHIAELYPSFVLGDADLTKRLTMRDALSARTGIPYDNLGTDFRILRGLRREVARADEGARKNRGVRRKDPRVKPHDHCGWVRRRTRLRSEEATCPGL
jgi:CubicO group peptidase (beta-lactamase class C family)